MRRIIFAALALLLLSAPSTAVANELSELVLGAKRILWLGDSITASGQYVADFNAWLLSTRPKRVPQIFNCGLPSETVSGLSEAGHAGGKFPRPDLAERLGRVLELTKPDLVFACYGINCGIYQPFDQQRFAAFQRGYEHLKAAVEKSGARLIVITPPTYDDRVRPRSFSYNEVLDRYSAWLVEQRKRGWMVIDLHSGMNAELQRRRAKDPKFSFQPDAVHPNVAGHWCMAQQILRALGAAAAASRESPQVMLKQNGVSPELLVLVERRQDLLRDAYVSTAGHQRPGIAKGLPIDEANARAKELTSQIQALLTSGG